MNKKNKKNKKAITPRGRMYIQATFNNTLVTATDAVGNVLVWNSAGSMGFKGARKSTPYAGRVAAKEVINKAKNIGLKTIDIFVSGVGSGRDAAIRALQGSGLEVTSIRDVTPIPHGGCRPKKPRRV